VIALIPARTGSKSIPHKNFRALAGGVSCVVRAYECAQDAGVDRIVISTDAKPREIGFVVSTAEWLPRPAALAQDETPMLAVVQHALQAAPGEPDDIWLLLQPTQPLRQPGHLQEAVRLLRETGADSVVSVVELPRTHSPEMVCVLWRDGSLLPAVYDWNFLPVRRQDAKPAYMRDGTVYAFRRRTVERHGTIYGNHVVPLIIPAAESCELDTPEQWDALEARLWPQCNCNGGEQGDGLCAIPHESYCPLFR
jgi:CMP-N,N'-diacetyllegionaminic acid synthase